MEVDGAVKGRCVFWTIVAVGREDRREGIEGIEGADGAVGAAKPEGGPVAGVYWNLALRGGDTVPAAAAAVAAVD